MKIKSTLFVGFVIALSFFLQGCETKKIKAEPAATTVSKSTNAVTTVPKTTTAAPTSAGVKVPEPTVEPKKIDAGPPPSDAIVLFNGKDLSHWVSRESGEPAKWEIKDGAMIVNGTGNIMTKESFGNCQLHLEWATPTEIVGESQGRGNSGVFLQDRYEVQVLDSYTNKTYFHGQAGAVYKQYVPLVNVSKKPGEWQTYDIIFHAPKFASDGSVEKKGRVTVLHNGVLVQDNVSILGTTGPVGPVKYETHPPKQPLRLQDHGNPVRYRNIWIRPL